MNDPITASALSDSSVPPESVTGRAAIPNIRPLQGLLCLIGLSLLIQPLSHALLLWLTAYALLTATLGPVTQFACPAYRSTPSAIHNVSGRLALLFWGCGLGLIPVLSAASDSLHITLHGMLLTALALTATLTYGADRRLQQAFTIGALLPAGSYLLGQPTSQAQLWALALFSVLLLSLAAGYWLHSLRRAQQRSREEIAVLTLQLRDARSACRPNPEPAAVSITPKDASTREPAAADSTRETHRHQLMLNALRSSQERLNQALDASGMGLWDWDLQHNRVFHSRLHSLLGYPPEQLQDNAQQYQALIHTADLPRVRRTLAAHLKGRSDLYRACYRIRHAQGHWVWLEDQGRAIAWSSEGKVLRLAGTRRDISRERAFQQQSRLAHTVFHNSNEGIFILDERFTLQSVNRAFCRILQQEEADLLGRRLDQSPRLHSQQPTLMRRIVRDLKRGQSWQGSFNFQRLNGSHVSLWVQLHGVRDPQGLISQYAGVIADQSHIEQTQERLHYLAKYDSLTGLANRAHFNTRLTKLLQQALHHQQSLALILIDVDRFKQINTSLGHHQGDQLLRALAKRMLDAHLPCQLLARLSGDEFALVTECDLDQDATRRLIEKLQRLLAQPIELAGEELSPSVSIGLCRFPDQARDLQSLVNQAGRALLHAKEGGGHRYAEFHFDMLHNAHQYLREEQALRRAVEHKALRVYYQPKLNLDQNRIDSAEALVRWQHPEQGLISPDRFIALAEQVGLINEIGDQVLEQAIAQASHWYKHGHWLAVAVNLSAPQLRQESLPERLQTLLQRYDLPAQLLELELTESQLLADGPRHIALLHKIRALGIKVSIDDFGTGYSSLSYLKNLPVDGVKIDQSFIRDILIDTDDLAISRAIIALAHGLRLRVTAEGVESAGHLQLLRGLGVNQVQGYFVSRPLPANQFAERFLFQPYAAEPEAKNPTGELG